MKNTSLIRISFLIAATSVHLNYASESSMSSSSCSSRSAESSPRNQQTPPRSRKPSIRPRSHTSTSTSPTPPASSISPLPRKSKSPNSRAALRLSWNILSRQTVSQDEDPLSKSVRFEKKILTLTRKISVPDDRGYVAEHEETVNLLAPDHNTHRPLYDHFKDDYAIGLPWILALFYYQLPDGTIARDYADGRNWNKYLIVDKETVHPRYKAGVDSMIDLPLVGFPEYYTVECIDNQFITAFLGTGKTARQALQGAVLRNALELKQTPEIWFAIGALYNKLGKYDDAIAWLQRSYERMQSESRPHGSVLHAIGFAYWEKKELEVAEAWLKKALKTLQEEKKPFHQTLNLLGCLFKKMGKDRGKPEKIRQAFTHFQWALQLKEDDILPLINILCLYQNRKALAFPDLIDDMEKYARLFFVRQSTEELQTFEKDFPKRYEKAYQTAIILEEIAARKKLKSPMRPQSSSSDRIS